MTGYGKAECELNDRKVTIEIKSLNSKTLDIYTKIPGVYREKELEIRNAISKKLKRGKVEFVLYYEITNDNKATSINSGVVKNYYQQLKTIADDLAIETSEQLLQMAIRLPDTLNVERDEIDPEDWKLVNVAIVDATIISSNARPRKVIDATDDSIEYSADPDAKWLKKGKQC